MIAGDEAETLRTLGPRRHDACRWPPTRLHIALRIMSI